MVEALRGMLYDFWVPLTVEGCRLEGEGAATRLVVLLRLNARPETLYGLTTRLAERDFPAAGLGEVTPQSWAAWVRTAIEELVDTEPGLPVMAAGEDGIVWIDLDA
jgi:hypothetical protein